MWRVLCCIETSLPVAKCGLRRSLALPAAALGEMQRGQLQYRWVPQSSVPGEGKPYTAVTLPGGNTACFRRAG